MESDLVKVALSPAVVSAMKRSVKGFGSGAGMGGLVGAGAGGAVGAAKEYSRRREEGASVGQAAAGGLGGGLRGALRGAAVGSIGGAALGAARPGLLGKLEQAKGLRGASHFGQRQVHALTGVGDANYVRSIGGGAAPTQKRLMAAHAAVQRGGGAKATKELGRARKAHEAAAKAERMGLTSLPGYAKALAKDPKAALKAGLGEQWHSAGAGGKLLAFGMPAAGVVGELSRAEPGTPGGGGRFERAGTALGAGLGYAAGPLPLAGTAVASPALAKAFGTLGRGVDRLTGRKKGKLLRNNPAPPGLEPGGGDAPVGESILTDRAMGVVPEING